MKTNAARMLDALKISFSLHEYEVDEDDLSAPSVAAKVGLPPEQVFKTLLAKGDKTGHLFAVIPADCELDLKALAKCAGDRAVQLAPLAQVQPLTGYIRGGVTVLGAKKAFRTIVHDSALSCEVISVSAGVRGTQIFLSPPDYVRATSAVLGNIARKSGI
jgi:Cys-tRNA(Pro)/Cys-tRNA(Cys) deacylase